MTLSDLKAKHSAVIPSSFRFDVKDGWSGILDCFFTSVSPLLLAPDSGWKLEEVREKMGMLRIECDVADYWNRDFQRAKMLAGFRSRVTCEVCGNAGFIRSTGWRLCRCDEHAEPDQKNDRPRPAWTIGGDTLDGYLWYDPEADDVRIVEDLASIGVPAHQIAEFERMRRLR